MGYIVNTAASVVRVANMHWLNHDDGLLNHGDITTWNHFLHHCSFVTRIHKTLVYSPHKGPVMWSFDVFFVVR